MFTYYVNGVPKRPKPRKILHKSWCEYGSWYDNMIIFEKLEHEYGRDTYIKYIYIYIYKISKLTKFVL